MSLEPLRRAVLEQAHAEAEATRRDAAARAAAIAADAEREGAGLVERAKAEAKLAAGMRGARARADARRAARGLILEAKRDLHDELHIRAREAALELRADPGYAALLEALCAVARDQLGEDAVLEIDSPDAGGVRGVALRRSVDYTLPALAERCVARLGSRIDDLWA